MDGVNKKILASFQGLRNKVSKKDKKKDKDKDKDKEKDKGEHHDKPPKDKTKIVPEKTLANGASEKIVPSGAKRDPDDAKTAASPTKSSVLDKEHNEPEVNALEQLPAPNSRKLEHITADRAVPAPGGKRLPTRKTPAERAAAAAEKAAEAREAAEKSAASADSLPEPDVVASSSVPEAPNEGIKLSPQMQLQAQMIAQAAQAAKLNASGGSTPASPAVARQAPARSPLAQSSPAVSDSKPAAKAAAQPTAPQYSSTPLGGEKIIKVFLEDDALKTVASPPPCTVGAVIDHLRKKMYLVDTTDFVLYETKNGQAVRILNSDEEVYGIMEQWQGSSVYKLVFKKATDLSQLGKSPASPRGNGVGSPRPIAQQIAADIPGSPKSPRSAHASPPVSPRAADFGGMRAQDEFDAILAYDPFATHIGLPLMPASRSEPQPQSQPPPMPLAPPPNFDPPPPPDLPPPPPPPADSAPDHHDQFSHNPPQPEAPAAVAPEPEPEKKVDIDAAQFPAAAAFLASLSKKPAALAVPIEGSSPTDGLRSASPAKPPAAKSLLSSGISAHSSADPKIRVAAAAPNTSPLATRPTGAASPALNSGTFAKKPPRVWSAEEVGEWMDSVGLHEHRAVFFFKGVAGQQLLELTAETMERDMLTPDATSRAAVLKAVENLKAERLNMLKQIRNQPQPAASPIPALVTPGPPPTTAPAAPPVVSTSPAPVHPITPALPSGGSGVAAPVPKLAVAKGKPMAPLKPAASPAPPAAPPSPTPGTAAAAAASAPAAPPASPRALPKPAPGVAPLVPKGPAAAAPVAAKPPPAAAPAAAPVASTGSAKPAAKAAAKPAAPGAPTAKPAEAPSTGSATAAGSKPAAKPVGAAAVKPAGGSVTAAAPTTAPAKAAAGGLVTAPKPAAVAAVTAAVPASGSPKVPRNVSPATPAAAPVVAPAAPAAAVKPIAKMAATPVGVAKAPPVGLQVDIVNDAILRVYFTDSVWRAFHTDGRMTADGLCEVIRQRCAALLPPGVDPGHCVLMEATNLVNEKPVEGVTSPLAVCKSWVGNSSRFMFKDKSSGPPKATKEVLKVYFADGTSKAVVVACTQTVGELCTQMATQLQLDPAVAAGYALYEVDDLGDSRVLLESDNVALVRSRWLVPDEAKLVFAAGKPPPPTEHREPSFSVLLKTKPHAKTRALVEQSRAFAAWANFHLAKRQKTFDGPLDQAMRDGSKLVVLAELLGGRPLPNSHANPTLIRNKLENVQNIFTFFSQRGLPVPKDYWPDDILDGNVHALLALLWPLVYNSFPVVFKPVPEPEARKALLEWCRVRAEPHGVDVDDFDISFRDGTAFAAILATCRPDVLDFAALKAAGQNMLRPALAAAETAGVPKGFLIADAFNHTEFNPDERAVFAYLTVYYRLFNS